MTMNAFHRRLLRGLSPLLAALPVTAAWPEPRVPDPAEVVRQVIERGNEFRRSQGLAPLAPEPRLDAAARGFADVLAGTDRFGHDADGRSPSQRATAAGYGWCMVAENLALEGSSAGFESAELAQDLVEGWIQSPGHRRNLLAADATQTGVALAHSARSDRWYAVQMFGRPASERITFDISNRSTTAVSYRVGDRSWPLTPGMRRTDQTCGTSDVEVALPGQPPLLLHPRDGTHFRIDSAQGRLHVGVE
jgi:uncharacterized protein YkwD